MTAKDLINYMIPPLKITDDVDKARQWMEEFRLSELPVTDQGKFLGILTEDIIFNFPSQPEAIGAYELTGTECIVNGEQHFYEVMKKAYTTGMRIVAVKDDEDKYLGVVAIEDVVEAFASSTSIHSPGAILVFSMDFRDYSLSEISRIIEMNDARVMSTHIMNDLEEPGKIKLTIKINLEETAHLKTALETRGYTVVESYSKQSSSDVDQDRLDSLMKYLTI
ncbi:MAG: CBS domain-containing protein [Cyclobacteriaceae bacterium]